MSKVYQGEYGVPVTINTNMDLTGATSTIARVLKPNGSEIAWTMTSQTPLTSGVLTYTTVLSDLDVAGNYKIRAEITFPSKKRFGETAFFRIYGKWE